MDVTGTPVCMSSQVSKFDAICNVITIVPGTEYEVTLTISLSLHSNLFECHNLPCFPVPCLVCKGKDVMRVIGH
jgi:hypothetical protein